MPLEPGTEELSAGFARRVKRAAGKQKLRPLIIGGSSRSGTTLLASMLGASRGALTVPEARFKWEILKHAGSDGEIEVRKAIRHLKSDWKFGMWGVGLPNPAEIQPAVVEYGQLLAYLASEYGRTTGKAGLKVWIDHTPGNVKHIAALQELLSDLKFVHLIRDGRAVAASQMPLDWGPNDIFEAARLWTAKIGLGLGAVSFLGPANAVSVRYEDLVQDPENVLKGLCDFAGLDYHDEMVVRREYRMHHYDGVQQEMVKEAPDPSRIERWRDQLTPSQIEAFEYLTGDMLTYLGYRRSIPFPSRPSPFTHFSQAAAGRFRANVINPVRRVRRRKPPEPGP